MGSAHPAALGQGGLRHPVITWGNGTGAAPWVYAGLLKHWASHGFVVIASNSTQTGSGKAMLDGVSWLTSEDSRPGSLFFGKIATDKIGASGHSQGGGGSVNAGNDPRVKCTAPVEPAPGNAKGLKGPMFLIAGSADTIVGSWMVTSTVYSPSPVPTVYGILKGATHFTPIGAADGMRGYLTAWFRAQLMNDQAAKTRFYGQSCGICVDPSWTVQRKNM